MNLNPAVHLFTAKDAKDAKEGGHADGIQPKG